MKTKTKAVQKAGSRARNAVEGAEIPFEEALAHDYVAPKKPLILGTTPAVYLGIEGRGAPGGPEFEVAIGALYGMAYTIKMSRKFAGLSDYPVWKLEARYLNLKDRHQKPPKEEWLWQLLIRTPDWVNEAELAQARKTLAKRGRDAGCQRVSLSRIAEGLCVQMLHIGPYEEECRTLDFMRAHAQAQGLRFGAGPHHEIYLSDPRRVEPARLRTILRVPVAQV